MEKEPKTIEDKMAAMRTIFGSVKEQNPQQIIQELGKLANSSEMKDFIIQDRALTSTYNF